MTDYTGTTTAISGVANQSQLTNTSSTNTLLAQGLFNATRNLSLPISMPRVARSTTGVDGVTIHAGCYKVSTRTDMPRVHVCCQIINYVFVHRLQFSLFYTVILNSTDSIRARLSCHAG